MELVETKLILDLDAFRENLDAARKSADKSGKSFGTKLKDALKNVGKEAIKSAFSMEGLRSAYDAINGSIERIAASSGDSNPAVQGFREVQAAATGAFDKLIDSVLSSDTAQGAMKGLTSILESAAEKAAGLGDALDTFVKENAGPIIGTADVLLSVFSQVGNAFNVVRGSFEAVVGAVITAAGVVVEGVGLVLGAVGKLADKIGASDLSAGLKNVAGDVDKIGGEIRKLGEKWVLDGVNRVVDAVLNMEGAYYSAKETLAKFEEFVLGVVAGRKKPSEAETDEEAEAETSLLDLLDDPAVTSPILGAAERLAFGVTDIFEGAVKAIGNLFRGLADDMLNALEPAQRLVAHGVSSLLDGVAALGSQFERAFGKSNAAAKVFARVQMGVQAAYAGVRGAMEFAESWAQNAAGNQLAATGHLLASTAFFAAAGLAGAQAGGLVGGGRGADLLGPQIAARAEDEVVQRTTNITFVIQGNLIDNDDYVRRTLIPALRRQVEEEDVVLVATHAQTAGSVNGSPKA